MPVQVLDLFVKLGFIDCVYGGFPLFLHLGEGLLVAGDLCLELAILHEQLVLLRHYTIIIIIITVK